MLPCVRCLRKILKAESGQTLAITLTALMLGILITVPFLSQAGTGAIGSRNYGTIEKEGYAADAGIEHAIWRLAYDGLAVLIPNVGDSESYQLPYSVNSITPAITITRTASGGSPAGTLANSVIDMLEYDTSNGVTPSILQIAGSVFAIVYQGAGSNGTVKTLQIDANGTIADAAIDTLVFDAGSGIEPCLVNVSGNVYAIAYRGPGSDGFVKTVTIASNGQIGDTVIDTLEFDTSDGFTPVIVHVSGDTFAVAYRGVNNDGFIRTMTIASDGQMGNAVIDTLEFDPSDCYEPDVIHVSGDVYAVVYRGPADDGFIKTMTIVANGQIGDVVIDTLEYDTSNAYEPNIIQVSGNYYAIAYRGVSSAGYLKTVEIAPGGMITDAVIDTQIYDNNRGFEPDIMGLGGNVFVVAYRGASTIGWVKTWEISPSGVITNVVIDSLEFDAANGSEPDLVIVASGMLAVAYQGPSSDGFVTTIAYTPAGGSAGAFRIQSVAGGCTITVSVQVASGVATVQSWVVQRQ